MTTPAGPDREWTTAALRPTATWVAVSGPDGRSRLEMVWSLPAPDLLEVASPAAGASTAA
jgi:hypothetical protein